jgi:hypothetical protein
MNGVIVPMAISGRTIHHGISRNMKNISAIAYRSAAGGQLLSYIVTSESC